jgi:hypothetical protein
MVNCIYNDDGMGLVGLLIWDKYRRRNGRSLHLQFHPPSNVPLHRRPQAFASRRLLLSGQVLEIFTDCH